MKLIIRKARVRLCNIIAFWPFGSQTSKGSNSMRSQGIGIIFKIPSGVITIGCKLKQVIVKLGVVMNHWKYFIVLGYLGPICAIV